MTSNVSSADDWDDGNWEDCPLPDEEEATISYEYDKNEDDDAHEIANCEHLPNEVLEEIFQYVRNNETEDYFLNRDHGIQDKFYDHDTVLKNKRDLWLYRMSFMDMLDGRHTLLPLALVCRRWNKVVTPMLYEEVQIDDCIIPHSWPRETG